MKTVSKDGRTWFEHRDGKTYVGFTKAFLDSLEECWHIVPASGNRVAVKENAPLCAIETNDGLFSVPSPVSGIISVFANHAMNFPDKLKENDEIATLVTPKEKGAEDFVEVVEGRPFGLPPDLVARINANLAEQQPQREQVQQAQAGMARWQVNGAPAGGAVRVNNNNNQVDFFANEAAPARQPRGGGNR